MNIQWIYGAIAWQQGCTIQKIREGKVKYILFYFNFVIKLKI
jgi:hypothetical protein